MSAETIPAEVVKLARRVVLHCQNTPPEEATKIVERVIASAFTRPAEPAAPVAEAGDGEVERRWIGQRAGQPAKATRMERVAEIWRDQGLIVTEWVPRSTLEAERARADAAEARIVELEAVEKTLRWSVSDSEASLAAAEQRAADALVRAENAADWQPIEAAPKGRVPFLALNYDGEVHVAAYDEHGRLMWRSHSAYRPQSFSIENGRKILISETEEWRNDWSLWTRLYEFKPTHWRPLPFLPRASREAQPATDGGDNG